MNVAYLLVSTAWLAGQTPPTTTTTTPAPIVQGAPYAAPIGGGYGGGCGGGGCGGGCDGCSTCGDTCCGSGGSGFFQRCKNKMRGMFSRGGHHGSSGCCDTCGSAPIATSSCCGASVQASCGCDDGCSSGGWCNHFKNKMRGMFRRHHGSSGCASDCGCGSDCGGGGCGGCGGGAPYGAGIYGSGLPTVGGQPEEKLHAPKDGDKGNSKLPPGDNKKKDGEGDETSARPGQVQINVAPTTPGVPPALEVAPAAGGSTAPSVNPAPRPGKGPEDF